MGANRMKGPAYIPAADKDTKATVILVQVIRVTWTKATRDSLHAAVRNKLLRPVEVPVSVARLPGVEYVMHSVYYHEEDAFQAADSSVSSGPLDQVLAAYTFEDTPVPYWHMSAYNLGLLPTNGTLRVDLWWNDGMPWRDTIRGLFTLEPDQWATLRYNWRSSGGRYELDRGAYYENEWRNAIWHYAQVLINIGLTTCPAGDVFVRTRPDFRYRDMARLW